MPILSHPITLVLIFLAGLFIIDILYMVAHDKNINLGIVMFALILLLILTMLGISDINKTQHPKNNGILQEIQKQKETNQ